MKKIIIHLFFCLSFILYGCGIEEWDTTLYVQKIEETSKILYKYDAWGGRDTNVAGYILLDSTEVFKVPRENEKLTFYYLKEIPNKNFIYGVDFDSPNYENPTKEEDRIFVPIDNLNTKQNNTTIKVDMYQYSGFMSRSSGYDKYTFERFKETRDSLFFYNLKSFFIDATILDSLKFKKQNVIIHQNEHHKVKAIDINDLRISDRNNEIISNKTYTLIPKDTIKSDLFSDYGIFKEVTTNNN